MTTLGRLKTLLLYAQAIDNATDVDTLRWAIQQIEAVQAAPRLKVVMLGTFGDDYRDVDNRRTLTDDVGSNTMVISTGSREALREVAPTLYEECALVPIDQLDNTGSDPMQTVGTDDEGVVRPALGRTTKDAVDVLYAQYIDTKPAHHASMTGSEKLASLQHCMEVGYRTLKENAPPTSDVTE